MRVFIAIDIDEETIASLDDLQKRLKREVNLSKGDVKWVKPQSMHLTLKFLGEVKDTRIAEVCNVVEKAAAGYSRFELKATGLGYFGKGAAKVLWIGIEENSALTGVQKDIEDGLAEAGWAPEARPFSGHLTLCRIRSPKTGRKLAEISRDYCGLEVGTWVADSVCVYQSELTPDGPVYTALGRAGFS